MKGNPLNDPKQAAGDAKPPARELIEIRVPGLKNLFNSMDASPFRERDLDPSAEELIVGWAREAPFGASFGLAVTLERAPGPVDETAALRDAIGEFFRHRATVTRRRLRELLRIGRTSLVVGLVFLVAAVWLASLLAGVMSNERLGELVREGLVICGWVAMWHPLEIFLYGWWPIRREAKLYDRLSEMPVRIIYSGVSEPGAWQHDWPAVSPSRASPNPPPTHAALLRSSKEIELPVTSRVPEPDSETGDSVLS
jgi:hypothetical protein